MASKSTSKKSAASEMAVPAKLAKIVASAGTAPLSAAPSFTDDELFEAGNKSVAIIQAAQIRCGMTTAEIRPLIIAAMRATL